MSEWKNVARAADIGPGQARLVEADGAMIALVNLGGEYVAIGDACTHDGAPLLGSGIDARDLIEGDRISCPRHGAQFCLRTGTALAPPAWEPVPTYPVRVRDGVVQVRRDRDG
jgi:3-phenylpropionate/trans-cinnamate dioxygenase ferredoxin subunit